MAWLKIDDGMMEHEKIVDLRAEKQGDTAVCVHLSAMGWCARAPRGTDRRDLGHIPDTMARRLGATPKIAQLLHDYGLWDRNGTGWLIHDWGDYQRVETSTERSRHHRTRSNTDAT